MSPRAAGDPSVARLTEAILLSPFPGTAAPGWLLAALDRGLAGVTLFGPDVCDPAQLAALTAQLRDAAGEPVIAIDEEGGDVTRMAHRHPAARAAVTALLAAHPDAIVVEMGLPMWRPPSGAYVATYGTARPNTQAAAEALDLTSG